MKTFFAGLGLTTIFTFSALAGEPFACRITSEDHVLDRTVNSFPMQGHGLQHYASDSFTYQGRTYSFDGQAGMFSDSVFVRLSSSGFTAIAKDELSFIASGLASVDIKCKHLSKDSTLNLTETKLQSEDNIFLSAEGDCLPPRVCGLNVCCHHDSSGF